jgi:hypothetical protein
MASDRVALQRRQDRGQHWWELRSCEYYDQFEQDKIVYQEIQFHSRFSLDTTALFTNNKAFFLRSHEPALLALLNSCLMWWFLDKHIGHMKDGAFAMQAFRVEQLSVARVKESAGERMTELVKALLLLGAERASVASEFANHARNRYGLEHVRGGFEVFWRTGDRAFLTALRKAGVQATTAAAQAEVLQDFRPRRARMRQLLRNLYRLEIELHHKVFELYGLTPDEVSLLRETAPPRDPLRLAEKELAELEREGDPVP